MQMIDFVARNSGMIIGTCTTVAVAVNWIPIIYKRIRPKDELNSRKHSSTHDDRSNTRRRGAGVVDSKLKCRYSNSCDAFSDCKHRFRADKLANSKEKTTGK
jgi:hypothetical protein